MAILENAWLRWFMLPILSIGGAFLGSTLFAILQWLGAKFHGGMSEDGWYYLFIMPLITSGVFGFLVSWIAYQVAPHGKLIAGVVLATLLGAFMLFGVFLVWFVVDYSTGQAVQYSIASIATIAGAVLGLYQANKYA